MSTPFDEFLQEVELERQESWQNGKQEGKQEGKSERLEEFVLILLEEGWPLAKISAKMKEPIERVQMIQRKFVRQTSLSN